MLSHRLIVAPEARAAGLTGGQLDPRDARAHTGSGMTRRGRLALALGATTYLAAWAFGSKILYPVGDSGCRWRCCSAWLWTALANRPLRIRRTLASGERLEGEDVEVTRRARLGAPARARALDAARADREARRDRRSVGATGMRRYVLDRLRAAATSSRLGRGDRGPVRPRAGRAAARVAGSAARLPAPGRARPALLGGRHPLARRSAAAAATALRLRPAQRRATTCTATRCARCTGARPRGAGS